MKTKQICIGILFFIMCILLSACKKVYSVYFYDGKTLINSINVKEQEVIGDVDLLEKEGHLFEGWFIGDEKWDLHNDLVLSDIILYAKWTEIKNVIHFDTDGGSEIDDIELKYGNDIIIPENPVKEGYTFIGWDKEIPNKMPAEDLNFKALWKVNQYTITFDTDGGSEIDSITLEYNSSIEIHDIPHKVGYIFVSWDKDIPERMPNYDITLKAIWKDNKYTITFDTDGGSHVNSIVAEYNTIIKYPAEPKKVGYIFTGWDKKIPEKMPEEDLIIKATYIKGSDNITDHNFDYYVNSALSGNEGQEISLYGKTLVIGKNVFSDLQTALDKIKIDSESSDYNSSQIYIEKGSYASAIISAPYVQLYGPNTNVNPNDTNLSRKEEATIIDTLLVEADDIVLNGLAFDFKGQVKASEMGGIDNLKIEYCSFLEQSTYSSGNYGRIELIWNRKIEESTGMITFINTEKCLEYSNLVVENCYFSKTFKRTQNIYGMQLDGLSVKNNVFVGTSDGFYDDCIKFNDFITYSIKGNIIIEGNSFSSIGQYTIWFKNYGPSNIVVKNNIFNDIGLCDDGLMYNRGALTITDPICELFIDEKGEKIEGAKISILFNKNQVTDSCLGLRFGYDRLHKDQVEAKVNFNIFEGIVKTDRIIYNNNKNPIDETNFAAIDASNNYYDIPVSIENFNGITSWEPVLQNREDALK